MLWRQLRPHVGRRRRASGLQPGVEGVSVGRTGAVLPSHVPRRRGGAVGPWRRRPEVERGRGRAAGPHHPGGPRGVHGAERRGPVQARRERAAAGARGQVGPLVVRVAGGAPGQVGGRGVHDGGGGEGAGALRHTELGSVGGSRFWYSGDVKAHGVSEDRTAAPGSSNSSSSVRPRTPAPIVLPVARHQHCPEQKNQASKPHTHTHTHAPVLCHIIAVHQDHIHSML